MARTLLGLCAVLSAAAHTDPAQCLRRCRRHGSPAQCLRRCRRHGPGPVPAPLPPTRSAAAHTDPAQCLRWEGDGGCEAIRDQARCLDGRDGRPWARWNGLLVAGQPCSWCGGEKCGEGSDALCMPHDWVKERAGISTANCSGREPVNVTAMPAAAPNASGGRKARWEEPERGARCSADRMEESERFNRYYWTFTAASAGECRSICASKPYCKGFGFEAAGRVCRAWWHSIDSTVPSPSADDECVRVAAEPAADGQQPGLEAAAVRALPDVTSAQAPGSPPALGSGAGAAPGGAPFWAWWLPAGALVPAALAGAWLFARTRAARTTRGASLEEDELFVRSFMSSEDELDEESQAALAAAAERQLILPAAPPVEPLAAWPRCEPVAGGRSH